MRSETVVVGGGAVGLITAWTLASEGIETIVIEEDAEIGVPEHDGGLYNIRGLGRIGLPLSPKYILNRVRGAVFKSPGGRELTLDAGRDVAIVADRSRLDKMLAEMAEREGAEVLCGERAVRVGGRGGGFMVELRSGVRVGSRWIVAAEGRGAVLTRRVMGRGPEREKWLPIIQAVVRGHGHDSRYVYLYFKDYLPDFFGYLIPLNDEYGKIGVASKTHLLKRFRRFMGEEFGDAEIEGWITHAIYTGRPMHPWNGSMFVPVGDAAGHVKATTGGGVMMGGLIGRNIARAIASVERGESPDRHLRVVNGVVGELERIAGLRKIVSKIPPRLYDKLFPAIADSGLPELLREKGDMDSQFRSILRIMGDPRLPAALLKTLLSLTPMGGLKL